MKVSGHCWECHKPTTNVWDPGIGTMCNACRETLKGKWRIGMNAYDVSKPLSTTQEEFTYAFGISQAKVAEQLRKLADSIENNNGPLLLTDKNGLPRSYVERFATETIADAEDFTISRIRITLSLAEKVKRG